MFCEGVYWQEVCVCESVLLNFIIFFLLMDGKLINKIYILINRGGWFQVLIITDGGGGTILLSKHFFCYFCTLKLDSQLQLSH